MACPTKQPQGTLQQEPRENLQTILDKQKEDKSSGKQGEGPGRGDSVWRKRGGRVLGRNCLRQSITSSVSQGRALGAHFLVQKSANGSLSTI